MAQPTSGYTQGNDLLVLAGGVATGHASSHTIDATTETKSIACKPVASKAISKAMYDDLVPTKKKVTVKCDGLVNYGETENGAGTLLSIWDATEPVTLKGVHRKNGESDADPDMFMTGQFLLTSFNLTANTGEEATYSATFESTGEVTFTPAKFPGYVAPTAGQALNAPASKLSTPTIKS